MSQFTTSPFLAPQARPETGHECLSLKRISKRFDRFFALNDISLTIYEGEFVCFLGPSGCGKTTLLRIIAGLETQTEGTIIQNSRDVSQLPPQARDFGIVFQSYALFPNLTAFDNIAYGLRNMRGSRQTIKQRVQSLLELIDLADAGNKYPGQLSGGQQQRVALARALAPEPGLLLLDEPLSALDAQVRVHLRRQIKALHERLGITSIMVTHDQEEALTLADRIVVMNHGTIEQIGTPREIYRHPANAFVANFVGTMNLLNVELESPTYARLGPHRIRLSHHRRANLAGKTGPARLAIRPEEVSLNVDFSLECPDTIPVQVGNIDYMGSILRVQCYSDRLEQPVLVDIDAWHESAHSLQCRSHVGLKFPPEAIRMFARQDA